MSFKDRLKRARKRAGYTQAKLAKKTGLATGTIQMYELGTRKPTVKSLSKIASALGVEYQFTKDGEPYFYTFVDTVEPLDNEDNIFNENQLLDAMNDSGMSIKTFETRKESGKVFNSNTNTFDNRTEKIIDLTDEAKLIDNYNNLNKFGKKEAIKRVEEMTHIPKYQKDTNEE